ncbi:C3a anaphylatoxin chemotactic receptor-like [Anomaloglossus baeobatrachus]|uniref:C3a anaphylatoxin chemotactic receptor-like n=1 Tax=Anomaloglossus baeobatrachus TaxID=238106 RepID=UPI003F50D34D
MLVMDKGSATLTDHREEILEEKEGRLRLRMDAADFNLTLPDIIPDFNNQSSYEFNNTSNTTSYSSSHDLLYIMQNVSIAIFSIVLALGIFGNGLVIWVAGFRMKKTVSAVWFFHLAIADFLCSASISLPIVLLTSSSTDSLVIICNLSVNLFALNMGASVLFLIGMSIDRWVSVMWPFWAKVHRTYKLVRITAGIMWLICFLVIGFGLIVSIFFSYDITEACIIDDNKQVILRKIPFSNRLQKLVIMFVIPFLIIVTTYVTIFFKLRKGKRSQRSQRSSRIITAVISCFFICWFPLFIFPLTPIYDEDSLLFHTLNTITTILACLNSCMNPIIYVFMAQDFQQSFLRSIPLKLEKALDDQPNDVCVEPQPCKSTRSTEG